MIKNIPQHWYEEQSCDQPHFNAFASVPVCGKGYEENFQNKIEEKVIMSSKLFMFWKIREQLLYSVYQMKSLLPFPSILYLKVWIPKLKRVDDRLSSSACPKYWMINNNIKALINLEISLWTKYFRFHNLTWLVWIGTRGPPNHRLAGRWQLWQVSRRFQ